LEWRLKSGASQLTTVQVTMEPVAPTLTLFNTTLDYTAALITPAAYL
jgi:hypothetical protein